MLRLLLLAVLFASLAVAVWMGALDRAQEAMGGNALVEDAARNIEHLRNGAEQDMVRLAVIDGLVEIVSTTSIGFRFLVTADLQVGNVLSVLEEALFYGGLAALATVVVSDVMLLTLDWNDTLARISMTLGFGALSAALFAQAVIRPGPVSHVAGATARIAMTLAITFQLLLPYAFHISGATVHAVSDHRERVLHLHDEVSLSGDVSDIQHWKRPETATTVYHMAIVDWRHRHAVITGYTSARLQALSLHLVLGPIFVLGGLLIIRSLLRELFQ